MKIYDKFEVTGAIIQIKGEHLAKGISEELPFPNSYIEFIQRFGYGLTCNLFLIYPPLGDYPDSFHIRSPGIKWALESVLRADNPSYDFLFKPDGSKALIPGLIGFATGENGESLFWDTLSPRSDGEYPIYLSGRGYGIHYCGETLLEFLTMMTTLQTVKKNQPFPSVPLPLTFKCNNREHLSLWLQRNKL